MFMMSESAEKMTELLKSAIDKGKLCADDYNNILEIASKDGVLDKKEEIVLKAIQDLIEHKLLVRVNSCDECPNCPK